MDYSLSGIITAIKERLSLLSKWKKTLFSGTYDRIINGISYIIKKLVYLAEFLYRESNFLTAQKLSSLISRLTYLNYTPHRKIGASGYIIITKNSQLSGDDTIADVESSYTYSGNTVIIPKRTIFTDNDEEVYTYSTEAITYFNNTVVVNQYMSGVAVDVGGGITGIPVSSVSNISAGDSIWIQDTENYDGFYEIDDIDGTQINIPVTYVAETFQGDETIISGLTKIPVKEGIIKEFIYVAEGNSYEEVTLFEENSDNVEFSVHIVDSNNNILNDVSVCGVDTNDDRLYFIDDVDNYYCEVKNSNDFNQVIFTFGDGITTKKLLSGTRVMIKYSITEGEDGNIQNLDTITKIKSTLTDSVGAIATLYVTNKEEISNGSDIEDIESIRNNATNLYGTGYRCGGYIDWPIILNNHSLILKSKIWSTDDVADDTITTNQNKIYAVSISTDGSELTQQQKNTITVDYLKDLKSPTEIISWQSLTIIYLKLTITSVVQNESFTIIQNQIEDAINNVYDITEVDFGENIYDSNVARIIDALDNVVYHSVSLYHLEKGLDDSEADYLISVSKLSSEESDTTKQIYLLANSLELWIELYSGGEWQAPVRAGYDSSGTIVADNGYTLSGTNITYSANTFSYTITDLSGLIEGTDYRVAVSYKTQDGDGNKTNHIRLANLYSITDYDPNYTIHSMSYETS